MAELIEIDFPRESEKNPTLDPDIKSQILDYNIKELDENKQEECPDEFKIDNYYKEDALGKMSYSKNILLHGKNIHGTSGNVKPKH